MRRSAQWQVPLLLAVLSVAAELAGTTGRQWLRYDRAALADGELWRLLTGHLVHLNPAHLLLNLAGLALAWLLVGHYLAPAAWGFVIVISIACMDAAFWLLEPALRWYVGLSGLLHGLLLGGLVNGLRTAPVESAVLGLLIVMKLLYEQLAGPLPGSEMTAGGPVVVDAHLYGALGGAAAGALLIKIRAVHGTSI
jgi:rhomboid family GlyGly-CTERM serine protease